MAKSVSEPKTGWAGVSHKDEGIVKTINDHEEYGKMLFFNICLCFDSFQNNFLTFLNANDHKNI